MSILDEGLGFQGFGKMSDPFGFGSPLKPNGSNNECFAIWIFHLVTYKSNQGDPKNGPLPKSFSLKDLCFICLLSFKKYCFL